MSNHIEFNQITSNSMKLYQIRVLVFIYSLLCGPGRSGRALGLVGTKGDWNLELEQLEQKWMQYQFMDFYNKVSPHCYAEAYYIYAVLNHWPKVRIP